MAIDIERMEELNNYLGKEREMHILKGQLLSPLILAKKDNTGHYMTFRLKTIKQISDDEYMQSNNLYQIVVSEEKCKQFGSAFFKELTGQEVIVLLDVNNYLRRGNSSMPLYFNNVSYYLVDIMKTRNVTENNLDF